MSAGPALGIAGLILGLVWLIKEPTLRYVSLASAVAAAAEGELTLLWLAREPGESMHWSAALGYFPLAVLAVGGWGAVLSGLAFRYISAPGRNLPLAPTGAVYLILARPIGR